RGAFARAVPANHAERGTFRNAEGHLVERGEHVTRFEVTHQTALQERAFERRELPAAVAPVDLGDVRQIDRVHAWSLDHFRERIAQSIEQPVSGEKYSDRTDAEREQPTPVPVGSRKKQNFLIRDRQMRERVDVEEA